MTYRLLALLALLTTLAPTAQANSTTQPAVNLGFPTLGIPPQDIRIPTNGLSTQTANANGTGTLATGLDEQANMTGPYEILFFTFPAHPPFISEMITIDSTYCGGHATLQFNWDHTTGLWSYDPDESTFSTQNGTPYIYTPSPGDFNGTDLSPNSQGYQTPEPGTLIFTLGGMLAFVGPFCQTTLVILGTWIAILLTILTGFTIAKAITNAYHGAAKQ